MQDAIARVGGGRSGRVRWTPRLLGRLAEERTSSMKITPHTTMRPCRYAARDAALVPMLAVLHVLDTCIIAAKVDEEG